MVAVFYLPFSTSPHLVLLSLSPPSITSPPILFIPFTPLFISLFTSYFTPPPLVFSVLLKNCWLFYLCLPRSLLHHLVVLCGWVTASTLPLFLFLSVTLFLLSHISCVSSPNSLCEHKTLLEKDISVNLQTHTNTHNRNSVSIALVMPP